jgi:hypothetical protein
MAKNKNKAHRLKVYEKNNFSCVFAIENLRRLLWDAKKQFTTAKCG